MDYAFNEDSLFVQITIAWAINIFKSSLRIFDKVCCLTVLLRPVFLNNLLSLDSSLAFKCWTQTSRLIEGITFLNPCYITDSIQFEFEANISKANRMKVFSSLVKWIITEPRKTECFPLLEFNYLLFRYEVSVIHISHKLYAVWMPYTE